MKKSRISAILAALSLSVGIAVVGAETTNAAQGDRHFINISTHGAPTWSAKAVLYDGNGKEVYRWKSDTGTAGGELWYFTDGGDGGTLSVQVEGVFNKERINHVPLDIDYCFLVKAGGMVQYTGNSKEADCTPD